VLVCTLALLRIACENYTVNLYNFGELRSCGLHQKDVIYRNKIILKKDVIMIKI